MRRAIPFVLAVLMLAAPLTTWTQNAGDAGAKNAKQARAALDAMVQALGGQAWLCWRRKRHGRRPATQRPRMRRRRARC